MDVHLIGVQFKNLMNSVFSVLTLLSLASLIVSCAEVKDPAENWIASTPLDMQTSSTDLAFTGDATSTIVTDFGFNLSDQAYLNPDRGIEMRDMASMT